jgi:hypothetical protein
MGGHQDRSWLSQQVWGVKPADLADERIDIVDTTLPVYPDYEQVHVVQQRPPPAFVGRHLLGQDGSFDCLTRQVVAHHQRHAQKTVGE